MPQGRKTAEEILGIAPQRPTAEEVLGIQPQRPTAEQVLGLPQQPPQISYYERLKQNIGLAAEQGFESLKNKAAAAGEIIGGFVSGDFRPLLEAGEQAARGIMQTNALLNYNIPQYLNQKFDIEEAERQQAARRLASGDTSFQQRAERQAELEARGQALDPSLSGRITRGVVREGIKLAPTIIAGAVSGGSVPAIAATTALSSLDEPANLPTATVLSSLPVPSFRAIRDVLGKGAAQIVEQEAAQAAGATARTVTGEAAPVLRAMGPAVEEASIRAGAPSSAPFSVSAAGPSVSPSAGLNAAINQAASQVPEATWKRVANEFSAFPRAMMSSLDISAPGRQGLLLSVAPSRWGDAIKAGRRMFQAFKPEAYERITKEIANHADAAVAEKSGLYLALRQAEEFFTSKLASKIPGVSASQRAYETYLDSLRMSTFSQYKRIIDKVGLDAAQTTRAYEAAAKWINYATGRGSLGKKFDDALPLLSQFLFAPRYTASRLNVLNPVMYYRNFKDPATRAVGIQQMKDLAQYLGAVAVTMGLAKAAGLDVSLSPSSGDFLKIRWGAKTYDPGAGLTQVMRFAIRASMDLFRAGKGEKAPYGQDVASLTERFIRSKLAPVPSYAWDFFSRRTYEGKQFTPGQAALGVVERVTPLTWSDFTSALWNEGLGEAAKTLPGATGIGVQSYTEPGGALERMQPLFSEYARAKRGIPEIRRAQGEDDNAFNARVRVFGEGLEHYGLDLVNSDEYRQADTAAKDRALILLPRRISSALIKQGEAWQLQPRVIMSDVKENMELRRELERERRR